MNNQVIRTDKAPAPVGPYNQAIAAPGPFLFVAGQIPLDPVTGEIVSGEISAQTEQVMANLEGILTALGFSQFRGDESSLCPLFPPGNRPGPGLCGGGPSSQRCASGNRMYCRFSLKIKVGIAHPNLISL